MGDDTDLLQHYCGEDQRNLHRCWKRPEDAWFVDAIRDGLIGALEKELECIGEDKLAGLRHDAERWITIACQLFGGAMRCTNESLGYGGPLVRPVLLMYVTGV